jgi:3-dehydroquinate synthase
MNTLFLYGPPASGKTTLGKKLAEALRRPFFDLDAEIAKAKGKSIPKIFEAGGEAAFRKAESETLRVLVSRPDSNGAVIALGGGTLLDNANRELAEKEGRVWCLEAPSTEELEKRIAAKPGARPLGNKAEERKAHYATFPRRVAQKFFLKDSLVVVGEDLGPLQGFADLIIADENAAKANPAALANATVETIPSGEQFKTLATVEKIWEHILSHGLGRKNTLAAFGGGVTGDLTGFSAATWMRGINWINFPTTLLSMVDASTGGKTGCDLPCGKNLVGAFHFPKLVLIDAAYLKTLPENELKNGRAEMIKHEIIKGLAPGNYKAIPSAQEIGDNLAVKVEMVTKDPYEQKGFRLLLNCGHTVGHALEIATNFSFSHGQAVAIGMVEEAKLAQKLGLAKPEFVNELKERIADAGLPTELPQDVTFASLKDIMQKDKKHQGKTVTFALPCAMGDVRAVPIELK